MTRPVHWGDLHVGDTVRGADGNPWEVMAREPGPTWLGSGIRNDMFTLRWEQRSITAARNIHEPAPVIARADHVDTAHAFGVLIHSGLAPHFLGETMTAAVADPFTAPATSHTVKRDRYGRYLLPDPTTGKERAWTRATTVARTISDEYNLNLWKLRMAVKGLALRPDLIASAAAADPETDKNTLNEIAEKAMERAGSDTGRNLGTALHAFAHRLNKGEALAGLGVPQPLVADLEAYQAALKAHALGVRPELCERIVVHPELGVAGTFDNIVTQPAGPTHSKPFSVFDLKTAKDVSYGGLEIAIQLAIYARSPLMWDPATQSYIPMPVAQIDTDRGLVLHLPVGKAYAQVYGVNLIEGWEAVQLAMGVREMRSKSKGLLWLVDPDPAALLLHRVRTAPDQAELARLWEQGNKAGVWTEEVNATAHSRAAELVSAA